MCANQQQQYATRTAEREATRKEKEWIKTQERIVIGLCFVIAPLWWYYYKWVYLVEHLERRLRAYSGYYVPSLLDLIPGIYWGAAILTLHLICWKLILVPVAAFAVKRQPGWDDFQLKQRREKFQHCLFLVFYYLFATVYGWYVLYDKPWVPGVMVPFASGATKHCWTDFWTATPPSDVFSYYLLSLGYALQSLVYLVFRNHRRDFLEMFLHHTLEISLIVYSYLYGYMRIGTLVLAVHDVGDVFINITRCTNEARKIVVTGVLFFMLLASWVYFRLYLFPAYVIYTGWIEGPQLLIYSTNDPEGLKGSGVGFFIFMLCALYVLHVFWFFMFLRMIYYFTTQHVVDDAVDRIVNNAPSPPPPADDNADHPHHQ